jgi:hypothetical protein
VISSTQSVRDTAPGDVIGGLFWALYNEGDVNPLTGPVAGAVAAYSGEVADVNLSTENHSHMVHIANAVARKYHPLLQLDDDDSGAPNDGDVVTLPPAAFNAPAGEHTTRNVAFDFLCVGGACDP